MAELTWERMGRCARLAWEHGIESFEKASRARPALMTSAVGRHPPDALMLLRLGVDWRSRHRVGCTGVIRELWGGQRRSRRWSYRAYSTRPTRESTCWECWLSRMVWAPDAGVLRGRLCERQSRPRRDMASLGVNASSALITDGALLLGVIRSSRTRVRRRAGCCGGWA